MSVLRRLDDFRGTGRFTTWVYKFALLEAAVKLRKRAWQGREVPLEPEAGALFSSGGLEPTARPSSELLDAVQQAIDEQLTTAPADVLVALALNGVRSTSSPSARHDAERSTRRSTTRAEAPAHLEESGLSVRTMAGGTVTNVPT
jgi:DNA-directed RNA polymerase specialized sigma24 family protein